jgi:hypothetical protein
MTATHVITYRQVLNLGFVRENQPDSVFFDINGYNCFTVKMKLVKGFYLNWDCEEHIVDLVRWKPKTGDILGRLPLYSIEEIEEIIEFFKKK